MSQEAEGGGVVRMPKLADTLVEGTVGRWLKHVGEPVSAGEPLAAIETDKVTTELSAPSAGTVLELLVEEGQAVPVETPIARIGSGAPSRAQEAARPAGPAAAEPGAAAAEPVASAAVEPSAASPRAPSPAPRPTPVAARLLEEHGLHAEDIDALTRRLTKDDVLRHLASRSPAPSVPPSLLASPAPSPPSRLQPLSSMRRAIAEHMLTSRHTIPHGQTVVAADLTQLWRWREATRAEFASAHGARLTFTVCFLNALAAALREIRQEPTIDLGVAVAVEHGLVVPVIREADRLSLGETARALDEVARRARSGSLSLADMQGGLMTLTNVGSFGNVLASPIVPVGQIGILAPGVVERRPMAGPEGIHLGYQCMVTLVVDRRVFDDFAADRCLGSVVDHLTRLAAGPPA